MRRIVFSLLTLVAIVSYQSSLLPIAHSKDHTRILPVASSAGPVSPAAEPLPQGCIRVTPPGQPEPSCCINGYVYIDGQVVAGAEVQIENPRGDQITLITQITSSGDIPRYQVSLSAPPLNVAVGETITVTARYSSHEQSLNYEVHPGGQQVDIVLAKAQAEDYVFEREFWGQAEPKKFNRPSGVAVDRLGNVYVTDTDNARVQVFDRDGNPLRQWGTRGNLARQFVEPLGIAVDDSSNVYIADTGNHRVQKFSSTGDWLATWGGFGTGVGQFKRPRDVVVDTDGDVYVTDTGNGRIQKLANDGSHIRTWSSWGDELDFDFPIEIAADRIGNVYILDGERIHRFDRDGTYLVSWEFPTRRPYAIATDDQSNVYISYPGEAGNVIRKVTPNGAVIGEWPLDVRSSLAVDRSGNIYSAANDRIQKFTGSGDLVATWGSTGNAAGQIRDPVDIAINRSGEVYVLDGEANQVKKLSSTGQPLRSWGTLGSGSKQFNHPQGIAVDNSGIVYVADTLNNRIQKFTGDGDTIKTWSITAPRDVAVGSDNNVYVLAGTTVEKFSKDGTPIKRWPTGEWDWNVIALDNANRVYLGSYEWMRIFTSDGIHVTTWPYDSANAVGVDGNGNVYTAYSFSYSFEPEARIQKYRSDGTLIATWGTFGSGKGQLDEPLAIAIDTNGRMYVSERGNDRIQRFHQMRYTKPIATITSLSSSTLNADGVLVADGLGQDSDETRTGLTYRWTIDGVQVGSESKLTLPAGSLTPGTHTLAFAVADEEGTWSDLVSTDIYVAARPQVQWTMLLYLVGDYHDRGSQFQAFNQTLVNLKRVFRNPYVRIAVQIDGPANGDTQRLLITPGTASTDPQVTPIAYPEQAMDDPAVLSEFIRWGKSTFPADHYYLAIADHGQALRGIGWDTTSDVADGVQDDNTYLTVKELGQALSADDVGRIDILHLDACAMNLLEVAYEVRLNVNLLIASQYLGWGYFAYDDYQSAIGATTTPREVARTIAGKYAMKVRLDHHPYTVAGLDLSRAEPTLSAVDALGGELAALVRNGTINRSTLDGIWQDSQKFDSNGDYIITPSDVYVDLVDYATHIQRRVDSPAIRTRAAKLVTELTGAEPFIFVQDASSAYLPSQYANGSYIDLAAARGVSIFYSQRPNTQEFQDYINDRLFSFTSGSQWADFLNSGVGVLPPGPLVPAPGPIAPLVPPPIQRVYVPLVGR